MVEDNPKMNELEELISFCKGCKYIYIYMGMIQYIK